MKRKFLKNVGIVMMALAICFLPQINAMATLLYDDGVTTFIREYADSNTWTGICATTSTSRSTQLKINVREIYKADGSTSNYKKVKVNPKVGQAYQGAKTASLNTSVYYSIPVSYRGAQNIYYLFAMGNNAKYDCMITGFIKAQ